MTTIPTNKIPRLNTNPITIEVRERSFNSLILIDSPKAMRANPKSVETSWWPRLSQSNQRKQKENMNIFSALNIYYTIQSTFRNVLSKNQAKHVEYNYLKHLSNICLGFHIESIQNHLTHTRHLDSQILNTCSRVLKTVF